MENQEIIDTDIDDKVGGKSEVNNKQRNLTFSLAAEQSIFD